MKVLCARSSLHLNHFTFQNIRVLVNFGSRPFRYQEANQRPSQESLQSMSMEEIRSNFQQLPFCEYSDHDGLGYVSDERRQLASDSETEGKIEDCFEVCQRRIRALKVQASIIIF